MSDSPIGVLLMALGGPDSLEAVGPYLQDIRGGRPTPSELVREITDRYRATGGKSPVLATMKEVARYLQERLRATGLASANVYVGMRHWHPYIRETYLNIVTDGVRRIVGVCMAPQNSSLSVGAYIKKVEEARAETGDDAVVTYVRSWNTHPMLIEGIAANIQEALHRFPAATRDRVPVIFTAHSLPEKILKDNDPYPGEVRGTVDAVLKHIDLQTWRFAYQSQGRTTDPWLGPTVEATLDDLHREGHRHVLIAPIGFVSDHLEILYDIDIDFKKRAADKGMRLERIAMFNASPPLIDTLADVIAAHLKETDR